MPPVKTSDHDTFGYRLIQILKKLNQGEKLDPKALAEEFNVNLRAIQRDLNERFAFLPLEKTNGLYHLQPTFLGRMTLRDVEHFARLAGVSGLFPSGNSAKFAGMWLLSMCATKMYMYIYKGSPWQQPKFSKMAIPKQCEFLQSWPIALGILTW